MNENWLALAFELDGRGGGHTLDPVAVNALPAKPCWIHLDINYSESGQWLQQSSGLDQVVIDALMAENTRPRVLELENAALVILRGVNLNENAEPEDMVSIRMYLDEHKVISTRKLMLKAVADIEERILKSTGPKTSGELLSMLAEQLCERMAGSITGLNELIDDLEEAVIENPDRELRQKIIDTRKRAIVFRRHLSPQRDVLAKLKASELPIFSVMDRRYFQESHDRTSRYVEDLDALRERAQIVQDELGSQLTDRINKNMYILSVIAAIFLPLSFFTGLLGINVGGLPGANDPQAFWAFSLLLLILVAIQVLVFKWRKWF